MIVNEEASQQCTSGWTTHWRRDERIRKESTSILQNGARFRHKVERSEFDVLIIRQEKDNIWFS